MANKRIQNKLKNLAQPREFTVQEAWDKVSEYISYKRPMYAACYFVGEVDGDGELILHDADRNKLIVSTKKYDDMKRK